MSAAVLVTANARFRQYYSSVLVLIILHHNVRSPGMLARLKIIFTEDVLSINNARR
ncbi:hypothetical protein [Crinalium epipsammum]|uniref:hypothetical protein n=1 Tax=Crinalium epipsammum TaxID=241425 RepID=UPI0012FAFACD|nr:hypothetical protein [Crinalium epipsammum]